MSFFTEELIDKLISEEKKLNINLDKFMSLKSIKNCEKSISAEHLIDRKDNSQFKIIIRKNTEILYDFSVILAFIPEKETKDYKILRYNGSHCHKNGIEKNEFRGFHIHRATERYQKFGSKIEGFAEITEKYNNFEKAIFCFIQDCNIILKDKEQFDLF